MLPSSYTTPTPPANAAVAKAPPSHSDTSPVGADSSAKSPRSGVAVRLSPARSRFFGDPPDRAATLAITPRFSLQCAAGSLQRRVFLPHRTLREAAIPARGASTRSHHASL